MADAVINVIFYGLARQTFPTQGTESVDIGDWIEPDMQLPMEVNDMGLAEYAQNPRHTPVFNDRLDEANNILGMFANEVLHSNRDGNHVCHADFCVLFLSHSRCRCDK